MSSGTCCRLMRTRVHVRKRPRIASTRTSAGCRCAAASGWRSCHRATPAPVVTVAVTTEAGETLNGELMHMDDFTVALRDASGAYRSVKRTAGVRVTKNDPYAAHVELLSKITDKAIHDVVAYLETLK